MGKVRPVSGAEVVAALARFGFEQVGQRGSHVKVRNVHGRIAIVPMHGEIAVGTLRSILRQAGITLDELATVL